MLKKSPFSLFFASPYNRFSWRESCWQVKGRRENRGKLKTNYMKYLGFISVFLGVFLAGAIIYHQWPYRASTGLVEPKIEVVGVRHTARATCYTDKGVMANGDYVHPGAVAVSDRSIHLNSKIYVEGYGEMVVADRTALWVWEKYGMTIDIWMTEEECKEFGLKKLTYKIL